jgi:hypothetical protein
MSFAWKVMLPFALYAVAATAVAIVVDSTRLMIALQLAGLVAFGYAIRRASLVGVNDRAPIADSRPGQSSSAVPPPAPGTEAAS